MPRSIISNAVNVCHSHSVGCNNVNRGRCNNINTGKTSKSEKHLELYDIRCWSDKNLVPDFTGWALTWTCGTQPSDASCDLFPVVLRLLALTLQLSGGWKKSINIEHAEQYRKSIVLITGLAFAINNLKNWKNPQHTKNSQTTCRTSKMAKCWQPAVAADKPGIDNWT